MKQNLLLKIHNTAGIVLTLLVLPIFMVGLIFFNQHVFNKINIKLSPTCTGIRDSSWRNVRLKSFKYNNNSNRQYIYGKAGILYTDDNLKTLFCYDKGLPSEAYEHAVNGICIDSIGTLWAATNSGAYFKTASTNWESYHEIPSKKILHIADFKGYMMIYFFKNRMIINNIDESCTVYPNSIPLEKNTSLLKITRSIHNATYFPPYSRYLHSVLLAISIMLMLAILLNVVAGLIWKNKKRTQFGRFLWYFTHNKAVRIAFFISIILYLLGYVAVLLKGNAFFEKSITYHSNHKLRNISNVEYDRANSEFLIAENNLIFSWDPYHPENLKLVYSINKNATINNMRYFKDMLYISATDGLHAISSRGSELLDSEPSYGVILSKDKKAYSVTMKGMKPLNNSEPFRPKVVGKLFDRTTLSEASKFLNRQGGKIANTSALAMVYHATILLLVMGLAITGFLLNKKGIPSN